MSDTILRYQVNVVDAPVRKHVPPGAPEYLIKSDAYVVAHNWISAGYGVVITAVIGEPATKSGPAWLHNL